MDEYWWREHPLSMNTLIGQHGGYIMLGKRLMPAGDIVRVLVNHTFEHVKWVDPMRSQRVYLVLQVSAV